MMTNKHELYWQILAIIIRKKIKTVTATQMLNLIQDESLLWPSHSEIENALEYLSLACNWDIKINDVITYNL